MKRQGSRNQYFRRRIPADVRSKAAGLKLSIPVGETTHTVAITPRTQTIRFSLGTDDPGLVKSRNAAADAYLEAVWPGLREETPIKFTNEQATALAGQLYQAWASGEGRERTLAVEQGPDGKMRVVQHDPRDDAVSFEAALQRWVRVATIGKLQMNKPPAERQPYDLDHLPPADDEPEPSDLEAALWPLVSRLLLSKGIGKVDSPSRGLLLVAFWMALRDALESRLRKARGDYSADPKGERFPAWVSPVATKTKTIKGGSLTAMFDG